MHANHLLPFKLENLTPCCFFVRTSFVEGGPYLPLLKATLLKLIPHGWDNVTGVLRMYYPPQHNNTRPTSGALRRVDASTAWRCHRYLRTYRPGSPLSKNDDNDASSMCTYRSIFPTPMLLNCPHTTLGVKVQTASHGMHMHTYLHIAYISIKSVSHCGITSVNIIRLR